MFKAGTFRSKSFWAGVVGIVSGIGLIVQGDMQGGITAIAAGVGWIFMRDAIEKTIDKK